MPDVAIVAITDICTEAQDRFSRLCVDAGASKPASFGDLRSLLLGCGSGIDAVYLATPHAFHAKDAIIVVDAGIDLLLEKPMVTSVAEALELAGVRRRTGSTVVVAYQGVLSPLVHDLKSRSAAGEFGELLSVSGCVWENWASLYAGQWKQESEVSGGGFMFDTGAHLMNTVLTIADSDFSRVAAFMNGRGLKVDVVTAVAARLSSGPLVTLHAVGAAPFACASHISFYFTAATVHVDAWGRWREIVTADGAVERDEAEIIDNPLRAFMAIREGRMTNNSSVEDGLRLAGLWDAIKASAAKDGERVLVERQTL